MVLPRTFSSVWSSEKLTVIGVRTPRSTPGSSFSKSSGKRPDPTSSSRPSPAVPGTAVSPSNPNIENTMTSPCSTVPRSSSTRRTRHAAPQRLDGGIDVLVFDRGANGTRRPGSPRTRTPERAATAGCPFSPRCPLAKDRCREEDPALEPITATRGAACWRLDVAAPELVPGRREADTQPEI